jgi:catechol 2,3-dioxygenase-like lactoylglutathione lyase family enzyme
VRLVIISAHNSWNTVIRQIQRRKSDFDDSASTVMAASAIELRSFCGRVGVDGILHLTSAPHSSIRLRIMPQQPPSVESNVQQAVPFFLVHDLEASRRFYVDGVGFQLTKQWVDDGKLRWCWLELGEAAIMLQEFWRDGHHRNVPDSKVGVGVSIAFICNDALAIYRELKARGIDASRPQVGNAMWVTEVVDPDGYNLFFESPTDAPEESIFSDDDTSLRSGT